MKKLMIALLAFAAAYGALAQSADWTLRSVRDPVQLQQKLNTDGAAVESRIAALEAEKVCQVDTNASTTVTAYTATRQGQLLVGNVGGTNALWVSSAAGTNGWVKVFQN